MTRSPDISRRDARRIALAAQGFTDRRPTGRVDRRHFRRVLERNTALPVQKAFAIGTTEDNQAEMKLFLFQGEDPHVSANDFLGAVRLDGLPPGPKGTIKVAVTLKLDTECVLNVEAKEISTGRSVRARLQTRYAKEDVQKELRVTGAGAQAAEEKRGEELKARSGRFWGFVKKVMGRA